MLPGVLRRGGSVGNRVALTFDDGPDHMTQHYLDLLDDLGVPATFFLIGSQALLGVRILFSVATASIRHQSVEQMLCALDRSALAPWSDLSVLQDA